MSSPTISEPSSSFAEDAFGSNSKVDSNTATTINDSSMHTSDPSTAHPPSSGSDEDVIASISSTNNSTFNNNKTTNSKSSASSTPRTVTSASQNQGKSIFNGWIPNIGNDYSSDNEDCDSSSHNNSDDDDRDDDSNINNQNNNNENNHDGLAKVKHTTKRKKSKGYEMFTFPLPLSPAEKAKEEKKKGCWSQAEDELLRALVSRFGTNKWSIVALYVEGRIGKQCRERWINHLDNTITKKPWDTKEDELLIKLQHDIGNRWTEIMRYFPGRSEISVKNRWHSISRSKKKHMFESLLNQQGNKPIPSYIHHDVSYDDDDSNQKSQISERIKRQRKTNSESVESDLESAPITRPRESVKKSKASSSQSYHSANSTSHTPKSKNSNTGSFQNVYENEDRIADEETESKHAQSTLGNPQYGEKFQYSPISAPIAFGQYPYSYISHPAAAHASSIAARFYGMPTAIGGAYLYPHPMAWQPESFVSSQQNSSTATATQQPSFQQPSQNSFPYPQNNTPESFFVNSTVNRMAWPAAAYAANPTYPVPRAFGGST